MDFDLPDANYRVFEATFEERKSKKSFIESQRPLVIFVSVLVLE